MGSLFFEFVFLSMSYGRSLYMPIFFFCFLISIYIYIPYIYRGETEPNKWYYQNLGEAEYVVAVYQYMRLVSYFTPPFPFRVLNHFFLSKMALIDLFLYLVHFFASLTESVQIGYPAEKISILTTYQGQKSLIRDVIMKRCQMNPFFHFGKPKKGKLFGFNESISF